MDDRDDDGNEIRGYVEHYAMCWGGFGLIFGALLFIGGIASGSSVWLCLAGLFIPIVVLGGIGALAGWSDGDNWVSHRALREEGQRIMYQQMIRQEQARIIVNQRLKKARESAI